MPRYILKNQMMKLIWLIVLLVYTICVPIEGSSIIPKVEWSKAYHVQAIKTSFPSGFVETIEAWYDSDNKKSRIDYNKAVTKIQDNDYIYEIHPKTTEEETNSKVCLRTDNEYGEMDDILPLIEEFEKKDVVIMDGKEVYRFHLSDTGDINYYGDLLAYNKKTYWVPFRYEITEYDHWHGSLINRITWEFYNYNNSVHEENFKPSQYNCDEEVSMNDNRVTNKMQFINTENKIHVNHTFNAFKKNLKRNYAHEKEHEMRKQIFQKSMRLVAGTNRMNVGYKLTINQFSDRTESELKRYKGLQKRRRGEIGSIPFPYTRTEILESTKNLPSEFDLRNLGVISPVRDQGDCGSCWAFGSTSAVEGALARSNGGRLMHLSEQAIIDCSWGFGGSGCDGGYAYVAFMWIMKYGLPTEEEYGPYLNLDGYCSIKNMTETYKIQGFTDVTPLSVEALKLALVNHGPVTVSVHASSAFMAYSNGILYDPLCNMTNLDHQVSLVGYGERDGDSFWILKNSWGQNWGADGYIYISTRDNNCGITTRPSYAVI